ncbi:hypothetical protein [Pseudophaeobacter flagellatus]|uniref:hypothetical protein n=1 Tax=Pseudophaeobacter flagellatus TaxID=2899119 RepID=UPI001E3A914D|nr:hypothetical protein [Pseudophaeobacter flagellatus]MCD9148839.1 hypothetical protein [Pseudophaeobacter flagellatus]
MAQAFYGAFAISLDQGQFDDLGEGKLVEESLFIDGVVQNAVRSHSINPASIEAEIRKALLPRLFNLLGGLDSANTVIEQVVAIVRAGDTRQPYRLSAWQSRPLLALDWFPGGGI